MATVLVVDDDADVRRFVVMILEGNSHKVLWASNGLEALMVYSSYRSHFDLVLTDVDMPQMDGIELATRIRALDPSKRIVLMSGRVLDTPKGLEDCPMLSKPFLPDELIASVEGVLRV